ncbi:hypothetical protein SAMN05720765_104170 [Fibrobacter sp. UWH6]|nr:hypothetical protein SAMN05720765_104170 [Fibrobacter sp. UWH6]
MDGSHPPEGWLRIFRKSGSLVPDWWLKVRRNNHFKIDFLKKGGSMASKKATQLSLSVLSDDILADVTQIVQYTRVFASAKVNLALLQRNWFLGRRIALEEMQGKSLLLCSILYAFSKDFPRSEWKISDGFAFLDSLQNVAAC